MKPKLCARIDIAKADAVKDVALGEEVTITITGRVTSLQGPSEHLYAELSTNGKKGKERRDVCPGNVTIEIGKFTVEGYGEFGADEDED